MVGFCKCGNKVLCSMKFGEFFFYQMRATISFSRRNIFRGVSYEEYGGEMSPM